jgi:hypothetical protein
LYCWIGEWFPTRKPAGIIFRSFQRLNRKVKVDGNDIWIHQILEGDEKASFEGTLGKLAEQWIAIWRRAGGMRQVLKA